MSNKYNAKPTELDGLKFASKAEAARYAELRLLEKSGYIGGLRCHPKFKLLDKQRDERQGIHYTADFYYRERVEGKLAIVVEEVKSAATAKRADYILRRKLFKAMFPDIIFREIIQ